MTNVKRQIFLGLGFVPFHMDNNSKPPQLTNKTTYSYETRWRLLLWCQPSPVVQVTYVAPSLVVD